MGSWVNGVRGWAERRAECVHKPLPGLGHSVDANQNGWVLCWISEWVGGQAWAWMCARVVGESYGTFLMTEGSDGWKDGRIRMRGSLVNE